MPLTALLEKLYARRRFGIRPGVDRVKELLAALGNPEKQFRSIHVVGTNGKGSTSAFLASILQCAGYRTAQFSSPHLVRFNERFRVDGAECNDDTLVRSLKTVLDASPAEATFFEITTALACLIFSEEHVDIAVIEAGMGGRSDATAAISAEMTLITPISFDHTEYLGGTLAEIADEKSGIIEPGTKVVSAEQCDAVCALIEKKCHSLNTSLAYMGRDFSACLSNSSTLDYHGIATSLAQISSGIPGRYQNGNAALALAAAELLEPSVSPDALVSGIAGARWPGRMELVPGAPPLLLDGAHNPAGAAALAEALADYPCRRILMVTGICQDKDAEELFAPLIPLVERIYTVTPSVERALFAEELSQRFAGMGVAAAPCATVANGIERARNDAEPGDMILVCGSLFVVGEAKAWLANAPYSGIRG